MLTTHLYEQPTDAPQPPPPAPPTTAPQPAPDQATAIAQAQAMAPTIDPSLIQFYASYSQDPATIVYYAQMAMYYQQQGYSGSGQPGAPPSGAPPAGAAPPAAHDPNAAQQYQSMNAYGTPTQGGYGTQPTGYGAAAGGPPANGNYGSPYNPQQQQVPQQSPPRHDAYDDRSRGNRGSYANMPPPPGL